MYRVVKESYLSYRDTTEGYRLSVMKPFGLVTDIDAYNSHKHEETAQYKQLSDFLHHIRYCKKCGTILDELQARGIAGKEYGIADSADLEEQHKILHMFLNLAYWK